MLFKTIFCILFLNYFSKFLNNNNNKKQENCKKQKDCKKEKNNWQQRKIFLNICCNKVLNSNLKQIFNCILKIDFLIQDIQQALDIFLETTIFAILFLQDTISTKCDN